jgi:hypothetical protein
MKPIKDWLCFVLASLPAFGLYAQEPVKSFNEKELQQADLQHLTKEFGKNKQIPAEYRVQILTALRYYPELKNVPIRFKIEASCCAPLTTTPKLASIFKRKHKRSFVITIRNLRNKELQPILFKNLDFNAQIGVIGHELGHVIDFNRQSTLRLIVNGIRHISPKYIDHFEYSTDSICIAHGLGHQLLSWSVYVRKSLHRKNWLGAGDADETTTLRERYMNPSTIKKRIASTPIYFNLSLN